MASTHSYGTNIAFIEELYEKYLQNPQAVSPSWQEFFQGYEPSGGEEAEELPAPDPNVAGWAPEPSREAVARQPEPQPSPSPAPVAVPSPAETPGTPLRGAASKIVQNMEASLGVPTATSVRTIPVKLLEENRRTINQHLALIGQAKTSYTHIIAWAIVNALRDFPRMNSSFRSVDDQPVRVDNEHVHFGLAIDVERKGSRSLLVPNLKHAEKLDFAQFLKAYNDLIRKARNNTLEISDFEGTTISLTNPGTIGTISSIPRLMQSQGTIVATGQIDYPAEYSATDPSVVAELGISKVMTMTSTYDHRIIQGAESGAFLARIHELLLGEDEFYDHIFRDLRIPYEPARWSRDRKLSSASRDEEITREAAVLQLINAYRVRGHLIADLDPLEYKVGHHPELNPAYYGLTIWDLDREFICGGLCGRQTSTLRSILETLRETYCGRIGPEYMHIQEPKQKKWLQDRMEPGRNALSLDGIMKRRILMKLNDAEAFERFLHTKYVGHKRFSLEGAESLVPMVDHLLNLAAGAGVQEVVIGMAHRGRLNVLANVLGKSYEKIFSSFEGDIDPNTTQGSGDVKYHLGAEGTHSTPDGEELQLTLASNPSHLEAVDPIVEGMVRAKQELLVDRRHEKVVPLLLHGDAAFAGQGVVAETLNLSQLSGYRTGGTVHIVINNQIGFTTGPEAARSSVYATDVAKMVQAPIFHVNGDDPEACVRAVKLAFEFRQEFRKDVVIDMVCYRRHGHNEGDEPSLTQPRMYKSIKEHRSVRKLYTETLLRKGDIDPEEAEQWLAQFQNKLQEAFDRTQEATAPPADGREALWTDEDVTGFQNEASPVTAISEDAIRRVGEAITTSGDGFTIHPKLRPVIAKRAAMVEGREPLDWAFGETMAVGSLLLEGHRVRLSGQDSGRGTFSHRHAIVFDYTSGEPWIPLNALADEGRNARFTVYDSLLSEYGVVGFEYGYSVADPDALVMWEAQFGDFVNGAQIIVDQFLTSAEEKWGQHSGLVLLLPHGYEGQGPEHSSARLERFLTLCAEGNMFVIYPTTPAQYCHALRRQMKVEPRKPLVVMTPKSLLRHPAATSTLEDILNGSFEPVLDDTSADADSVRRVLITSGKVYYDLRTARDKGDRSDVAIVRLEQYYPWPQKALSEAVSRYRNAERVLWVQEEPRNMGAWTFVGGRISSMITSLPLSYCGRPPAAAPATGSHRRHEDQQKAIVEAALNG
jgi:multifunctional 2-oxoglutarate metabolism enzyme